MLEINSLKDCCGCTACYSVCPNSCIKMITDSEGFNYPKVDYSLCVDCGLCRSVCPTLCLSNYNTKTTKAYGVKNVNENIRKDSSSGGVFSAIAELVIRRGGKIFGAEFDRDWSVKHSYIDNISDIKRFRGSKYVQSDLKDTFLTLKTILKENTLVLFSGTPCQVKGLKLFLNKDYDNLICLDFICHGVPSNRVWEAYLSSLTHDTNSIESIQFRDKKTGWKSYSFTFKQKNESSKSEFYYNNAYMKGFLRDLYLRPSCNNCPAKKGISNSDITLADFWGVDKLFPQKDDLGVSLVIVNNSKGASIFSELNITQFPVDLDFALKYNPSYNESSKQNNYRYLFFNLLNKGWSFKKIISICLDDNLTKKIERKILNWIYK